MLSIGKLAQGQEAYYVDTVAGGAEEYYLGHGEAPGEWVGRSASRLELVGEVDGDDLAALLRHADPRSGDQLTKGGSSPKVAGFDLTFCAPKSVSLLWAFGTPEVAAEVVAAHEAAVRAALGVMEAEAAKVRRGHGGVHVLRSSGLVAAAFRHRTSRAGDPHVHTHVVTANLGWCDGDGRWSALDARPLYRWAQPVGYLYEAQLRDELTRRLGVTWGPVRNGIADIEGVPRSLVDLFSTRRRQILEHLEAHGTSGGRAAQVATYATRRPKQPTASADGLQGAWVRQAVDAGHSPRTVAALARPGLDVCSPSVDEIELFAALAGPDGVTSRRSTFDRRDVVKAVCDRLPSGAPVEQVMELVSGFLDHEAVVGVGHGEIPSRWTSLDLLACERRLVDVALRVRRSGAGRVRPEMVATVLDHRPHRSGEQVAMVAGLCRSGHGVEVVIGAAGSGKTSALGTAREAWESDGYAVVGCALAARAAEQLQEGAGIASSTLDRLLADLGSGRRCLGSGSIVVVDEAGMVGTRQVERLVQHTASAGAKLVLVGDPAQLPAIEAGGALAGLARRLGCRELSENHRQVEGWERELLSGVRVGETVGVPETYAGHGRVQESGDVDAVIERWWDARQRGGEVLLLAGRRDQVTALNAAARARLRAADLVGPDRCVLNGRPFAVGEEVVALRNDHRLGVVNGSRGVIAGIGRHRLDVKLGDGRLVRLPHEYAEAGWLDHGYALTIHKAQGLTADETIVLADDTLSREHIYVAISRGRLTNRIAIALAEDFDDHVPAAEATTPEEGLSSILHRSAAEDLAIDIL